MLFTNKILQMQQTLQAANTYMKYIFLEFERKNLPNTLTLHIDLYYTSYNQISIFQMKICIIMQCKNLLCTLFGFCRIPNNRPCVVYRGVLMRWGRGGRRRWGPPEGVGATAGRRRRCLPDATPHFRYVSAGSVSVVQDSASSSRCFVL